jgi:SulP family sulfate permease
VVIDLSASPHVDLQSAHELAALADELRTKGVSVQVVEARSAVRERFDVEDLGARLGGLSQIMSIADAVRDFRRA